MENKKKVSKKYNRKNNKKFSKKTTCIKYKKSRQSSRKSKKSRQCRKKGTKKYKMKGGTSQFNNISEAAVFRDSDIPSMPTSVVPFVPSPIMDLKWSMSTGLRNFFNSIAGQPRQFTSSPTDQPIGKLSSPVTVMPISKTHIEEWRKSILSGFR